MCNVEGNFCVVLCTKSYSVDRVKEDKADGTCGIRERGGNCKQNFSYKPIKKELTLPNLTVMGGQF
jgi:hypothetical protein